MNEPRRVSGWAAIARFGGVGDNLMAAVALPGLKRKYGRVEVITGGNQAVVFENNPHIDKLAVTEPDTIPNAAPDQWQGWFRRRSVEYDFFANLSHTCETMRALMPTQTQFWWPASFRREFCKASYLETVLDVCGLPHEFGPLFFPTAQELEQARETKRDIGGKVIAWIISGTRIDKLHPNAPSIIARLVREVAPVVMLGAPAPHRDFAVAKSIQEDVIRQNGSDRGLFLGLSASMEAQNWPIRRVLAFSQVCDIVIGPDTGPMWAVAFEPNAKVLLLSHASVENVSKHWVNTVTLHADSARVPCWPCHQLHDTGDTCTPNKEKNAAACISDISVPVVVDTAMGLLGEGNGQRRLIRGDSGA